MLVFEITMENTCGVKCAAARGGGTDASNSEEVTMRNACRVRCFRVLFPHGAIQCIGNA